MHIIFDLDNTLFATKDHVQDAYREAGVEMPDDCWSLPWRKWLPDIVGSSEEAVRVHDLKNEIYSKLIRKNPPAQLMPLDILLHIKSSGLAEVGILTGASRLAVQTVLAKAAVGYIDLIGCGMSREGKIDALHGLAPSGIYVDDVPFVVPGWRVVGYNGNESRTEFLDKLWMQ